MDTDRSKWTDEEIRAVEGAEQFSTELDNTGLVSEFTQAIIMWTHHRKNGNRVSRDLWVKVADVYEREVLLRMNEDD